jgi:hypothetical protein
MFNIVKRRDFMLGQYAQTRQEAEKLLAEKYGQDHIVVEASEPTSDPCIRQSGGQVYVAERAISASKTGKQAGKSFAKRMIVPNKNPTSILPD